jgi:hypothetical protein
MRKFLLILFCYLLSFSIYGQHKYYVAPSGGSDGNAGTIAAPWATWQKAFNTANAGDTVYFRGGVWYLGANDYVILDPSGGHGNNGTHANPICFFNYPGEVPILDAIGHTNTSDASAFDMKNATYIYLKGLTVRNQRQHTGVSDQWIASMQFLNNGFISLDQITCHSGGGYGIWFSGYDTLYLTNCDSYNHSDTIRADGELGNRSDGFQISSGSQVGDYTYIYGCRGWNNSDDGMEISTQREYYAINCWMFNNGRFSHGAGTGFKYSAAVETTVGKRRTNNCLAAFNKGNGFSDQNLLWEDNGPINQFFNNTSYRNRFAFDSDEGWFVCGTGYTSEVFRNNIAYEATYGVTDDNYPSYYTIYLTLCAEESNHAVQDHNSWIYTASSPYWNDNPAITLTDADFQSLDVSQLQGARKSDGSLPDITFLKLASGSDLIDVGTDVGLPYSGSAPDLGYAEASGSSLPTVTTTTIYSINVTTASGGGSVTNDGGDIVTARGVCWSISSNPTIASSHTINGSGTGVFTSSLTSLTQGTFYYVRAYATNANGTGYGSQVTFTTLTTPFLTTVAITSITETTAVSGGTISSDGGSAITEKGVCWSISANPTIAQSHTSNGTGSSAFASNIAGLTGGFTYFVRAYATNSVGTSYGNQLSFVAITPVEEYKIITDGIYVIMDDGKVISTEGGGADILVTGITVSGTGGATTISVNDGTLQMLASVLPIDATDPTVTWSRTNGTGTASISTGGLLTALTNGNVTTRATANDGSGIYDDQIITLSNQNILVTGITVTGTGGATTISTPDGTLQLITTVLPVDASNPTVTWSVTSGTGYATIGSSGILTAVTDGTVTARATANDGSGVYGTLEVTISNQIVSSQIIADHTIVDRYDKIPQQWIDSVKKMLVWIPGMSHGYGYFRGAELLEAYDSKFQVNIWYNTDAPAENNIELRLGRGGLAREYFYTSTAGINQYKTNIYNQVQTGNPYDVIGFGWSYQGTWENDPGGTKDPIYNVHWAGSSQNGPEGNLRWGLDAGDQTLTGNSVCMDTYLTAVEEYNSYSQIHGYPTKTIFTTLCVDGDEGTEAGFQRELKSQHIRDYVNAHNTAILFDYADILCYNNSGTLYTVNWNDGGTLRPHQQHHPDNMKDYDVSWNIINRESHDPEDHIGEVGALRLAKALWWMLARIAGWDGN